ASAVRTASRVTQRSRLTFRGVRSARETAGGEFSASVFTCSPDQYRSESRQRTEAGREPVQQLGYAALNDQIVHLAVERREQFTATGSNGNHVALPDSERAGKVCGGFHVEHHAL